MFFIKYLLFMDFLTYVSMTLLIYTYLMEDHLIWLFVDECDSDEIRMSMSMAWRDERLPKCSLPHPILHLGNILFPAYPRNFVRQMSLHTVNIRY